jgi:branched-chain amino acid transport system permease protein
VHALVSSTGFVLLYGISYGVVLFTISVGLVVTLGLMRVVNMAHGAFAAIGGYAFVSLMGAFHVPFGIALALAVIAVAALGVVLERLVFTGLYGASDLDQVLITVGVAFVAVASLNLFFGPDVVTAPLPPLLAGSVDLGFRTFESYRIFVVVLGAALIAALWYLFERTPFGARLRSAVDNRGMAEAIGINVRRLYSVAFALGCGLAALGGAAGYKMLPLEPSYPIKYLALVLIVVALAGLGNVKASAAIAILVGIVDTAARFIWPASGNFVIYLLVIAVMTWRSQGLFVKQST